MRISPGQHLGPYALGDLIGSGGMGEVYRARDLRLERDVAIKVVLSHNWIDGPGGGKSPSVT